METILEVQTIQPIAVPTVSGMLKTARMPATKKGYDPKPLLVNANEKLPTTNVIIIIPKVIEEVSSKAYKAVKKESKYSPHIKNE